MKKMFALLALTLSISGFAQERVVLDYDTARASGPDAILVRTAATPNTVVVTFQVPMTQQVCERYDSRLVIVTSGSECGYDQDIIWDTDRYCARRNPHNKQCVRYETRRVARTVTRARTCSIPQSYCASYGTVTNYRADNVKIKFKNLPALTNAEEETFLVSADQKRMDGDNVVYNIRPLTTIYPLNEYEVDSRGVFGDDFYVIKLK